eukprot:Gb_03025 [translate_table: standard]
MEEISLVDYWRIVYLLLKFKGQCNKDSFPAAMVVPGINRISISKGYMALFKEVIFFVSLLWGGVVGQVFDKCLSLYGGNLLPRLYSRRYEDCGYLTTRQTSCSRDGGPRDFMIEVLRLICRGGEIERLCSYHPVEEGEMADGHNEQVAGLDSGKRSYTLLQGHAGPVYAANFSPEGDFILSASADCTGMVFQEWFDCGVPG